MRILFGSGSPAGCGHTAFPAALLKNRDYESPNPTGCTVDASGSSFRAATGHGHRRHEKGGHHRYRFAAAAIQHLLKRPQRAGSFLRPCSERRVFRHTIDSIGDFFSAHLQEAPWPRS